MTPGIVVVVCDTFGRVEIHHFKSHELGDALAVLDRAQSEAANWGKCYQVRESDGRYIFHREFQQRFNL